MGAQTNDRYKPILGESFYNSLSVVLFKLGHVQITRADLPRLSITSMRAVRNLQALCERLDIRSIADLAKTNALELSDPEHGLRCGVQTLYIALRLLRNAGYDDRQWYSKAILESRSVTWESLKARHTRRDRDADKREKASKAARNRKHARNEHESNIRRFIKAS